jgi:predicted nucleic acid-binding protein
MAVLPIEVISGDDLLVIEAARFKARTTASYADCSAAALALCHRALILTGDHNFMDLLRILPEMQLHWLGP